MAKIEDRQLPDFFCKVCQVAASLCYPHEKTADCYCCWQYDSSRTHHEEVLVVWVGTDDPSTPSCNATDGKACCLSANFSDCGEFWSSQS